MMFALLNNMKMELMVGLAVVLFVPTAIACDGGR